MKKENWWPEESDFSLLGPDVKKLKSERILVSMHVSKKSGPRSKQWRTCNGRIYFWTKTKCATCRCYRNTTFVITNLASKPATMVATCRYSDILAQPISMSVPLSPWLLLWVVALVTSLPSSKYFCLHIGHSSLAISHFVMHCEW